MRWQILKNELIPTKGCGDCSMWFECCRCAHTSETNFDGDMVGKECPLIEADTMEEIFLQASRGSDSKAHVRVGKK